MWCVVGHVVSLGHSTVAALLQFVCYETAHPLRALPPAVEVLTLLALAGHQINGRVVCCEVCQGGVWG